MNSVKLSIYIIQASCKGTQCDGSCVAMRDEFPVEILSPKQVRIVGVSTLSSVSLKIRGPWNVNIFKLKVKALNWMKQTIKKEPLAYFKNPRSPVPGLISSSNIKGKAAHNI